MDRSKAVYKDAFQRLRDLKAEIERIQRVLEAGRLRMQGDFEAWYADCLMRLSKQTQGEAQRLAGGSGGGGVPFAAADPAKGGPAGWPSLPPSAPPGLPAGVPAPVQRSTGAAAPAPAPPASSTGNAAADADIAAFFKAKALLSSVMKQI
jgi:kinesin family protein 6/9